MGEGKAEGGDVFVIFEQVAGRFVSLQWKTASGDSGTDPGVENAFSRQREMNLTWLIAAKRV